MSRKETDLLRKARAGDTAAFGEIVRRYQGLVYATVLPVVGSPAAAQDAAQEAFLAAYAALPDLRSDAAFPAWLRRIARNKALAGKREQARTVSLGEAGSPDGPPVPPDAEAEDDRKEADRFADEVGRAVASLSEALRFPVLLCYLDGVPTAEAARYLGIREGTLRKRLHDGKRKLQERIVKIAEKTLQEYRLPRDFARRCICGCRRAREEKERPVTRGRRRTG